MRALIRYLDSNDGLEDMRMVNVIEVGRNEVGPRGSAFTIRVSDGLVIFSHDERLIAEDYEKVLRELLSAGYVDLTEYDSFVDKHLARKNYSEDNVSSLIRTSAYVQAQAQ